MALLSFRGQGAFGEEERTAPWSVQVPGRREGEVATPMEEI